MIALENVSYSYKKWVGVTDVNLKIERGEFTYIIGPTGSGKTTLMRLIYMDLFPEKGRVLINGFDTNRLKNRHIPRIRKNIGMIFQSYNLLSDRDLFQNVALPLHVLGMKRSEIKEIVSEMLNEVGLYGKEDHYPEELSGGEQQRACVARALVKQPEIILADEPTGNLDPITAYDLLELLDTINGEGTAVFMASHNYTLIRDRGHRMVQIQEGKLRA
ncbi:MAG: ATP-binding cassette domain-containing protein [Candidatus Marinimicrobia bacterium]|nr:ATP-binding cassette domain-containing protein [Candidatus Neomarinimicrobiota bacterium]